jgi:AraC family ethanolamine operon transcriptional activator
MATIVLHNARDVDDQADALTGWEQAYEQLDCGPFCGSTWQLVMRDGVVLRETTNRKLGEHIVPPPGHVVLALPICVRPGSLLSGRALSPSSLIVLSGQSQSDLISEGEMDLIGVTVRRSLLEQSVAPEKLDWLDLKLRDRIVELPSQTAEAIQQRFLCSGVAVEHGLESLNQLHQEQALLSSLLSDALALAMTALNDKPAAALPRRTEARQRVFKRAVDFMREHLRDDIGVTDICFAACASRRTLQYCFEEFVHTSPQVYLRLLRLREARRLLKADASPPITDLASQLGFSSASHFTQQYKRMFDELPSLTLRHHR